LRRAGTKIEAHKVKIIPTINKEAFISHNNDLTLMNKDTRHNVPSLYIIIIKAVSSQEVSILLKRVGFSKN